MLLIADSGSTKTHWCLVENNQVLKQVFTKGINPFYQTEAEISSDIEVSLLAQIEPAKLDKIVFYGAGCSFPDKKAIVRNALQSHFEVAEIEICNDLLGAARALFGNNQGIACILGTGSNSCYYNGSEIVDNVSPLGFILGDEGSGAVLAKTLVADCLKNQLPQAIITKFFEQYNISPAQILEAVYKKPFPNRFLAQFSVFLYENLAEPSISNIVYNGFVAFFKRNVLQYQIDGLKVGVIGSVGFYFKELLTKAAHDCGLELGLVEQSPMMGLLNYHVGPDLILNID